MLNEMEKMKKSVFEIYISTLHMQVQSSRQAVMKRKAAAEIIIDGYKTSHNLYRNIQHQRDIFQLSQPNG